MKKLFIGLGLLASVSAFAKPTVEIGLLLDSSGSMGGLINKTRNTLWSVINDLENATKNGELPEVKIGLYSYGNAVHPDAQNEIVLISNLTGDLDALSEEFFKLTASGGSELAGKVINTATTSFNWTESGDFKALFLAGNETVFQGEEDPLVAAENSKASGIIVNTIYAQDSFSGGFNPRLPTRGGFGSKLPGSAIHVPTTPSSPAVDHIKQGWINVSVSGGGNFAHISNNEQLPHIATPFDQQILDLDKELNTTFVPFGSSGQYYYNRMITVDGQISSSSIGSMVSRGRYKVGSGYGASVSTWDLVEAYFSGKVQLSSLSQNELPNNLKEKTEAEIIAYLEIQKAKRDEIKAKSKELYKLREEYVKEQRAQAGVQTIEDIMKKSLRTQLIEKGFEFN